MTVLYSFLNPSSRWYCPLRWLVLILLGWAIYAQTLGFNFVFDDMDFIVNNHSIKQFAHVHYIWRNFPQTRTIGFYSFALNYFINQLHPQGYHLFNFFIHLLAVGLIWATAEVIFRIAGWLPSTDRLRREIPFIIAVLFLVHPCQTQAVTYISQRFESIATVFYLGSVYAYLRGRISSSQTHKILLFIGCAGCAILGILTKEVAVTIPGMLLAAELIFFKERRHRVIKTAIILTLGGFFFFILFTKLLGTGLNIFFHFHPIFSESHNGEVITVPTYLLTEMRVFLTFMRLLILPIQQNLDYDYPLSTGFLSPPLTLIGMCLIGAAIFLIFKLRKRFPTVAFGLAWILITFSINLAPRANVIFEHKLYLISFGFFLALVSALFIIIRPRKLLIGILITMATLLSVSGFFRNQIWKNELTLWDDVIQKSPHKARPYRNRGLAYANQGNFSQAIADYTQAIAIDPKYADAYYNRGIAYDRQGNFSQAICDYTKAINIIPNSADAYNNRGIVYGEQNNVSGAISDYNKAIELNPAYAQAYVNRANIYDDQKNSAQAISDYNKAIASDPDFAEAYYDRAVSYYQLKNYGQAWSDVRKAEKLGYAVNPELINALKQVSADPDG